MKLLNELTIREAQKGLRTKEFSAIELAQACLKKIKERNEEINAFVTVTEELALEQAKNADKLIASGQARPLTGIPYSAKDAICVEGVRSTASAKILDNYIPPFDATVIKKIREQGGVLVGKTNCDAFGHGASNENSMYGPVRNPHDLNKVAGGSSGGSAASVADNMCLYSIAEDTGGSIRQPSAFCGVAGLRPSYGRNSRHGIMPMASSLDTVGSMAKTVEDVAIILNEIAGQDTLDATTVPDAVPDYANEADLNSEIKNLRIGVPKEYYDFDSINPEIRSAALSKINQLEKMGCKIEEVSLPHTKYATAAYYIIVPCEDSSNLGRMDGVRYGMRASNGNLYQLYAQSRESGFPEEVKRRILIGTYALSAGYYDAYYKKAQKVRTLIKRDFEEAFKKVDVLITPTSPFPAFDIGEKASDTMAMYLADVMLIPASLAGVPGLSIPAGKTSAGLPIGMQVIGPRLQESKVLQIGNALSLF